MTRSGTNSCSSYARATSTRRPSRTAFATATRSEGWALRGASRARWSSRISCPLVRRQADAFMLGGRSGRLLGANRTLPPREKRPLSVSASLSVGPSCCLMFSVCGTLGNGVLGVCVRARFAPARPWAPMCCRIQDAAWVWARRLLARSRRFHAEVGGSSLELAGPRASLSACGLA